MAMKASHTADTKGMSGKTRSHIVSRLEKGAKVAETLVEALSQQSVSGASATDLLEAHAYAALLRGSAEFEKQSWQECLKSYSVARIVYSALTTSAKGDIFKDLLTETIDPSIRYAAYQAKIPRTQPVPAIARKAFQHVDSEVVAQIKEQYPEVLNDQVQGPQAGAEGVPSTISWRGREVKIEDAAIAVAWGSVADAKAQLSEKLASADALLPKDMAGAYDDILAASQDAVDATKTAIDELKSEGVPQSDSRMQSLQITRTAVNFEMISWRIGRNRVLAGKDDGAHLEFGQPPKAKKGETAPPPPPQEKQDEAPGRQIAKLKEKVVLYDGTLQSLDAVAELPGVANDQDLSSRLEATKQYFAALKYGPPHPPTPLPALKTNPPTPPDASPSPALTPSPAPSSPPSPSRNTPSPPPPPRSPSSPPPPPPPPPRATSTSTAPTSSACTRSSPASCSARARSTTSFPAPPPLPKPPPPPRSSRRRSSRAWPRGAPWTWSASSSTRRGWRWCR